MTFESCATLGEAIQDAYEDTLTDWLRLERRKADDKEDLLANDLKEVEVSVSMKSGGRVSVSVMVFGKKRHQDLVGYYRYAHKGGEFIRVQPA